MVRRLILVAVLAALAFVAMAQPATRTARSAATSATARQPMANRVAASATGSAGPVAGAGGGLGGRRGNGGHDDHGGEDEVEFSEEDLAGSFAFSSFGFFDLYVPEVITPRRPVWIALEGRICSDKKGEATLRTFVNVQGYGTFEMVSSTTVAGGGSSSACKLQVDEWGQGRIDCYVTTTALVTGNAALTAIAAAFPSKITIRFQASSDSKLFMEWEGCGAEGFSGSFPGGTYPVTCTVDGRRALALSGVAERITFRCKHCGSDATSYHGATDSICKEKSGGHGGGPRGPGGGRGNWGDEYDVDL